MIADRPVQFGNVLKQRQELLAGRARAGGARPPGGGVILSPGKASLRRGLCVLPGLLSARSSFSRRLVLSKWAIFPGRRGPIGLGRGRLVRRGREVEQALLPGGQDPPTIPLHVVGVEGRMRITVVR